MQRSLIFRVFGGELVETVFIHPLLITPVKSIRGKAAGVFSGYGTFQWTSAVQSLTLLLLKSIHSNASGDPCNRIISGGAGSLAASLDYAITKDPLWIAGMFGVSTRGESVLRRAILRTNSNQKRPGPVSLKINEQFLPIENIHCFEGEKEISNCEDLGFLIDDIQRKVNCKERREVENLALVA